MNRPVLGRAEGNVDPSATEPVGQPSSTTVDGDAIYTTLLATGMPAMGACFQLWRSGDESCRATAVRRLTELFHVHAHQFTASAYQNEYRWSTDLGGFLKAMLAGETEEVDSALTDAVLTACAGVAVAGGISFEKSPIRHLPVRMKVGDSMFLHECALLQEIPDGVEIQRDLNVKACENLKRIGKGLKVGRMLALGKCPGLTVLPDGLNIETGYIRKCGQLESLPKDLVVQRDLEIEDCESWDGSLPAMFHEPGSYAWRTNLKIIGCKGLETLPDGLTAKRLEVIGCSNLKALPKGLRVTDNLEIPNCRGWDGIIPEDARIGGLISLGFLNSLTLGEWRKRFGSGPCPPEMRQ